MSQTLAHAEPKDEPVGVCGHAGYRLGLRWADRQDADTLAGLLTAQHEGREVVRNPHRDHDWAWKVVGAPELLALAHSLIGPAIAVENTFLLLKWPRTSFAVPLHQDGINDRIQLDPARSLAVWAAITPATVDNGCLQVLPSSQTGGYRSYERVGAGSGEERQRPLSTIHPVDTSHPTHLTLRPGEACAMDVRLLHQSGPNRTHRPRVGLNIRYVAPGGIQSRDGSPPVLDVVSGDGW